MSRRARNRQDRRAVNFDGPAPDIEAAFAKLTAERVQRDEGGDEGETITTKDGSVLDLRKPWPMPGDAR